MENLTILQKYYEYANAGDWSAWCDLFADDMVMDEQLAGRIEGLDTLRPMMDGMGEAYAVFVNEPSTMFVSGDEGAAVSHISARAARYPDESIEADVMNHFRFKGGKISYMANFHDSKPFEPFLRQISEGQGDGEATTTEEVTTQKREDTQMADNTQLVLRMYDCFGKGDMDTIRNEIFDADIVWHMPGHHPLAGDMQGVDEVLAFFESLFQAGIRVDNVHFGELDDGTVVEKHTGHGSVDGEDYIFPTATSYTVKDGKIAEVQVHTADQHSVDRYMWKMFKLQDIGHRLDHPNKKVWHYH